jgi:hypothetical protein
VSEKNRLLVRIEYGGVTEEISGDFDMVTRQTMKFLYNIAPKLSLLDRIKLEIEDDKLIEEIGSIIKISSEGPVLLKEFKGLKTSDVIVTYLVGSYLGYKLGILSKDSLTVDQLSAYTIAGKDVVRARLSELGRSLMVEAGEVGERRITKTGLMNFEREILPRLIEDSC